jgi:hypothetical protein
MAVLVGLERYDAPGFDQPGPAAGAIRIAEWLLARGNAAGGDVRLFVTIKAGNPQERALEARLGALAGMGAEVVRSGNRHVIETCLDAMLTQAAEGAEACRFLLYWCGHGYAWLGNGDRLWTCQDTTIDNARFFNGTAWCRRLGSVRALRWQTVLADACAVPWRIHVPDSTVPWQLADGVEQSCLFATREGSFAFDEDGIGVFTGTVVGALEVCGGWPDEATIERAIVPALEARRTAAYRLYTRLPGKAVAERMIGVPRKGSPEWAAARCETLLERLGLSEVACEPLYRLVLDFYGFEYREAAQDVPGMVRHLARTNLVKSSKMSRGLLQFTWRLARKYAGSKQKIEDWIARGQKGGWISLADCAEVTARLDEEDERQTLIVELANRRDRVKSFRCRVQLRSGEFTVSTPDRDFVDWGHFQTVLPDIIDELIEDGKLNEYRFDIHFLVDLRFLYLPFHNIRCSNGFTLGKNSVVLVRWKGRDHSAAEWKTHAAQLHRHPPNEIGLHPIPADQNEVRQLPSLYFAAFAMCPNLAPALHEKIVLHVSDEHVPYVVWLHEAGEGHSWEAFRSELKSWLGKLQRLPELPQKLKVWRLKGEDPYVGQVSMLWDNPSFPPAVVKPLKSPWGSPE